MRLWLSAVHEAPDVWVPHVALGEALQSVGSHDAAVAEYQMAIVLRPSEPVPYMKLGLCLAEMRRLEEPAQVFPKLERLTPGPRSRGTGWVRSRCCKADTMRRGSITGRRSPRIRTMSRRGSRWR